MFMYLWYLVTHYFVMEHHSPRLEEPGPEGESQDFGQPRDTGLASTDFGSPGMTPAILLTLSLIFCEVFFLNWFLLYLKTIAEALQFNYMYLYVLYIPGHLSNIGCLALVRVWQRMGDGGWGQTGAARHHPKRPEPEPVPGVTGHHSPLIDTHSTEHTSPGILIPDTQCLRQHRHPLILQYN